MKRLADLLADYLQHGRSLQLSPYTLRMARYQVHSFLDWLERRYGVNRADQVRSEHLENWVKHLAGRQTTRGLPLKPATINKLIENVRGFLKYLAGHGLVAVSLPNRLAYVKAQPALFLDRSGRRLPYHTLRRMVRRQTEACGVTVTPHTFRRSCTTELIRGGANLYHVKELLGHESLETLQHYTKLTIEDLRKTHQKCHPRERSESR